MRELKREEMLQASGGVILYYPPGFGGSFGNFLGYLWFLWQHRGQPLLSG